VQLFFQPGREKDPICGVVGQLQFEVLTFRLEHEYGAKVVFDRARLTPTPAGWRAPPDPRSSTSARVPLAVMDIDGQPVALFRDQWELDRIARDNESWTFHETAPIGPVAIT
jgi:peptide chain release factor 3